MQVLHSCPPGHRRYDVNALAYSPDGEFLLAGVERRMRDCWAPEMLGRLLRFDVRGRSHHPRELEMPGVLGVAWSADGERCAAVTGTRLAVFSRDFERLHSAAISFVKDVRFSPSTGEVRVIMHRFNEGGVIDFDLAAFERESRPEVRARSVWSGPPAMQRLRLREGVALAENPVTGVLAVGGCGDVTLRNSDDEPYNVVVDERYRWFEHVEFSPDGGFLAAASGSRVYVCEVDRTRVGNLLRLRGHGEDVTGIAFSGDGRFLLSSSLDGTVRLWDPSSGREVACLDWEVGPVRSLACHPDGSTAAIGGGRHDSVVVFDLP